MPYAIRTEGGREYWWLCEIDGEYRWRHGKPARALAIRFETARDAEGTIVLTGRNGAGGGIAKVVEVED
jgi:DUF1365 family protein